MPVRSLAHITGGGFHENIPRSLPDGLTARIDRKALRVPPIFRLLQCEGGLDEGAMFRIFNMGVGMTAVVGPEDTDAAVRVLRENGSTSSRPSPRPRPAPRRRCGSWPP